MSALPDIRPSPIAGTWYHGRPDALSREVDGYLNRAELPALPGDVVALIAPHAGHRYSGAVAGYAFAAVRGRAYDVVAVISPFHQYASAPLLVSAHRAYETPLGIVPLDEVALATLESALRARAGLTLARIPYDHEHSLEIELPFLQRALAGNFQLLPVMVSAQTPQVSQALGDALAETLRGRNALLVASTDLSHFYDQNTALRLDAEMLRRIEAFDPPGIFEAEQTGKGFACGHAAVAAVLWAARSLGADTVTVLRHATSGDVTGDFSSVVGYGAAVITRHSD
ncbi:MAG: AmmeMemoRadiSam system protein B [Anaerolineales bacterium]